MKSLKHNLEIIKPDILKIKSELGKNISKVGLFGSSLYKDFNEANDIDIVIYCSESIDFVKEKIISVKLNIPIYPHKVNGTYGSKEDAPEEKHYHIILLNENNPNPEFEKRNKNKIVFI